MKNYFNENQDKAIQVKDCYYVIADCVETMRSMPKGSVNTIVTSPPYNLNKKYGKYDDNRSFAEWEELIANVADAAYDVLTPDGSFLLNVSPIPDKKTKEIIPLDATVSMNCWGFTPDVFEKISAGFEKFLDSHGTELRAEYYLPYSIKEIMDAGMCDVSVYPTDEAWYGVTYKEDREAVVNGLSSLKNEGVYPEKLH